MNDLLRVVYRIAVRLIILLPVPGLAGLELSIDTEGDAFAYELKDSSTGELVYWMPSSYQPIKTGSLDFTSNQTKGVSVKWNDDQTAAVVEEANHNSIGQLWILATNRERLPVMDLLSDDIKRRIEDSTDVPWERRRYFFQNWISANTVVIRLAGRYLNEQRNGTIEAMFDITLAFGGESENPVTEIKRVFLE